MLPPPSLEVDAIGDKSTKSGDCDLCSFESLNFVFYGMTHQSESSSSIHGTKMTFDMHVISSA